MIRGEMLKGNTFLENASEYINRKLIIESVNESLVFEFAKKLADKSKTNVKNLYGSKLSDFVAILTAQEEGDYILIDEKVLTNQDMCGLLIQAIKENVLHYTIGEKKHEIWLQIPKYNYIIFAEPANAIDQRLREIIKTVL